MARLEEYELGRVLAKGGMGVVHEALERASGRRVALKRILPGLLDRDAVERFLLEGRAVARLAHPGIVAVHAMGEAGGAPFLVMELVAGESLQRRLEREGPLDPALACALARQLAEALAHAHARGVLHRDLKPANVLVDSTGAAKVIDFGLAKLVGGSGALERLTRTGELVGTPAYMAPEQANGQPVDARTDVHGLGATLHALLTGAPPFSGTSPLDVLAKVLERAPAAPSRLRPGLSPALDALVRACLAKSPDARPGSMEAVLARLDGLEQAVPAGRRRVAALAGAALLAGAAGAALLAAPPRSAPTPADTGARPAPVERDEDAGARLARARERARTDLAGALAPPADDVPPAAWLAHGLILLSAERCPEARAVLERPGLDGLGREVVRARLLAALEPDPRAADARPLERALKDDPGWVEGRYALGLHRLRTTGAASTREVVNDLRGRGGLEQAACLRAEAALAERGGEAEAKALAALDKVLGGEAGTPRAWLLRGTLHAVAGREAPALRDLDAGLAQDPLSARGLGTRAWVRARSGDLAGAASDQRRLAVLVGGPTTEAGRRSLLEVASLDARLGRYADVLEDLAGFTGRDADVELARGVARFALGDLERGLALFEAVLRDAPRGSVAAFRGCGDSLDQAGRPHAPWPARYLAQLRREAPGDKALWHRAALSLAELDPAVAEEAAGEAARLGAGSSAAVLRARLLGRLDGRVRDALAAWDALVSESAADPWRLLGRAALRAASGDPEGAASDRAVARDLLSLDLSLEQPEDLEARARRSDLEAAERAMPGEFSRALSRLGWAGEAPR